MLSVDSIYNDIVGRIEQNIPLSIAMPVKTVTEQKKTEQSFETVLNEYINGDKVDYTLLSKEELNDRIEAAIRAASEKYNLDYELIKAVIKAESDFDPYCVSSAGAKGLMQLMPETAAEVGVTDPFNIEQNIDGATRYIKKQIDRFGDLSLGLAAFNAGPGNVNKYGGIPPFKETQNYVPRVLSYMSQYKLGMD